MLKILLNLGVTRSSANQPPPGNNVARRPGNRGRRGVSNSISRQTDRRQVLEQTQGASGLGAGQRDNSDQSELTDENTEQEVNTFEFYICR